MWRLMLVLVWCRSLEIPYEQVRPVRDELVHTSGILHNQGEHLQHQ